MYRYSDHASNGQLVQGRRVTLAIVVVIAMVPAMFQQAVLPGTGGPSFTGRDAPSSSQSSPSALFQAAVDARIQRDITINLTNAAPDTTVLATSDPVIQTSGSVHDLHVEPIARPLEPYPAAPMASLGYADTYAFQEIKVPGDCFIPWVNVYIQFANPLNLSQVPENWTAAMFTSVNRFPDLKPIPARMVNGTRVTFDPRGTGDAFSRIMSHWKNVSLPRVMLRANTTASWNGIPSFFLGIVMPRTSVAGGYHIWYYSNDTDGIATDAGSAFIAPALNIELGGGERVKGELYEREGTDFTLLTALEPASTNPEPSTIGLKVNNEPVVDRGGATGDFSSRRTIVPVDGKVGIAVSSAWSDFGGVVKVNASIVARVEGHLSPVVSPTIHEHNSSVSWEASLVVPGYLPAGLRNGTLVARVPVSWTGATIYNSTGPARVPVATTTSLSPSGKHWIVRCTGITPGTWLLVASSPLLLASIVPGHGTGALVPDGTLASTTTITGGPNGKQDVITSDASGGIAAVSILQGMANDTNPSTAWQLDGASIGITNATPTSLDHIASKIAAGDFMGTYGVGASFDVALDLPAGFTEENLGELHLLLDQGMLADSWFFGNVSAVDMPDNPAFGGPASSSNFLTLLYYDFNVVTVPFMYNHTTNHYSDLIVNVSLTVFNQHVMDPGDITSLAFILATNFSRLDTTVTVLVIDQVDGSMVALTAMQEGDAILNDTLLTWTSKDEGSGFNLTRYIAPGSNTIQLVMRAVNDTQVAMLPGETKDFGVDMFEFRFEFTNRGHAGSIHAYNWTAGDFVATPLAMDPGQPCSLDLSVAFPGTFRDFLQDGIVRIRVSISSHVPIFNDVTWSVDRVAVSLVYSYFVTCEWIHAVETTTGIETHRETTSTLFDSPANNHSFSIDVPRFLAKQDNYALVVSWTNGSDVALGRLPLSVARWATRLEMIKDHTGPVLLHGDTLQVAVALTRVSNGSAMAGRVVTLVMHVMADTNIVTNVSLPAITNEAGVASFAVTALPAWRELSYTLEYREEDPAYMDASLAGPATIQVLDTWENVARVVMENLAWILAGAIVVVVALLGRYKVNAGRRKAWERDAGKVIDVVKIQHLLVIMKDSGTCIVNRAYSRTALDGDLVSGFLHAITTFGKEIGPKSSRERSSIVFDYQDFKILLHDGVATRVALILDGEPTANLKEKAAKFVDSFEARYDMSAWRGSLDMFADVDTFIEQAFEITLVYPLVVDETRVKTAVKSSLGRALVEVGQAVQKEKRAFYLATLLDFALAGRKEPRHQILAEIYRLKTSGAFTFYTPDT